MGPVPIRDPQGNVLATYEREYFSPTDFSTEYPGYSATGQDHVEVFHLQEYALYGSKRLGLQKNNQPLSFYSFTGSSFDADGYFSAKNTPQSIAINTAPAITPFIRGQKFFELSNHLGNVLAIVSDRRLQVADVGLSLGHYFTADLQRVQDYYPFGMTMPGRELGIGAYRYGFNGKETDNETNLQDYGFRIYNPRIGKFLSIDPLAPAYPWYTPYQFAGNSPIRYIDLDGMEPMDAIEEFFWEAAEAGANFYLAHENEIEGMVATLSGVGAITTGILLTMSQIPPVQLLGGMSITYGIGQTGYGIAKFTAAYNGMNQNELMASNNYGQLIGNELDKGFETNHLGTLGYYGGEGIELAGGIVKGGLNLSALITRKGTYFSTLRMTTKNAEDIGPLKRKTLLYLTGSGLTANGGQALNDSFWATYDLFIAEADQTLSGQYDIISQINIVGDVSPFFEIHLEAEDSDGNLIIKSFQFELEGSNLKLEKNFIDDECTQECYDE